MAIIKSLGSSALDADIVNFFAEITEFYGHGSPQARIVDRIQRKLGVIQVGDKYDRLCPTCKCPLCGKTRAQAAALVRQRQERGRQKWLQRKGAAGIELSQPTSDFDDELPSGKGFSVLDIEQATQRADEYKARQDYNVSK